ncbi:ABC transporter ATP-binding protein [Ensifer sp. ENS05]|uniref:ABC transporter ATP-binding protein n=1 Tax=Ensifer sp. ENS05 TaxID=2769277 RepID=UPI00178324F3|nr:ABC transporter ATP-binding protein [Ensifer sp. ENS05]MBD9597401.1 ABC transporter ATP-binding protein [Ensifer sp. ENS05]
MAFVEVTNVRKLFGGRDTGVVALDEANLAFDEGEFVALLGPSGCGKTTLLKIVSGLLPKTSGSVRVGGKEITGPYPDYGFVFQQASLMPWRTVRENVLFPMEILGKKDKEATMRADELLGLTGLSHFADSRPHELSGGMQQRVSLCRALIHKPKLLLMDEPFGALDEFTRLEMNDLLLKIRDETKASILFVTHSISEAVYLSDRVVIFSRRPARVQLEFKVGLPRVRTQSVRFTPEFTDAERRASEALGILGAH